MYVSRIFIHVAMVERTTAKHMPVVYLWKLFYTSAWSVCIHVYPAAVWWHVSFRKHVNVGVCIAFFLFLKSKKVLNDWSPARFRLCALQ